jgi:hypothetical protein
MQYCSTEARKIVKCYPDGMLDRFSIERALECGTPHTVKKLIDKYGESQKSMKKITAMLNNGYLKNLPKREIGDINWDKIMFHYYYLSENYLKEDFSYSNIVALNDIANFNFEFIDKFIKWLRVKNLWYLRKVLISESMKQVVDAEKYKNISDADVVDMQDKGEQINTGHLEEYADV